MKYGTVVNGFYLVLPAYSKEPHRSSQQYLNNKDAGKALRADYPSIIILNHLEFALKALEK